MIVDTSAIMAIVKGESDAEVYAGILEKEDDVRMSAGNWLELGIVTTRLGDEHIVEFADRTVSAFGIIIEPVTVEQGRLARQAFQDFGKGRHPAKLNFGDCFAYALAAATGEALLFKGEDFKKTRIRSAC